MSTEQQQQFQQWMQTPTAEEVGTEAARLSEEILEQPLAAGRTDELRLQFYLQHQQSLDSPPTSRQVLAWLHTQLQISAEEADSDCDYGDFGPTQQEDLDSHHHSQQQQQQQQLRSSSSSNWPADQAVACAGAGHTAAGDVR